EGGEALGRSLRERLRNAHISPAPVLGCVGRAGVILRDLRHPPVPAAEEPGLIRFQVAKELTDAADDVVIDYTPLAGGTGGDRRALAVVLRKPVLAAYQALCRGAGLRLAGLTPRPFGLAACLQRAAGATALTEAPPADAPVAMLSLAEGWAEFCVVR